MFNFQKLNKNKKMIEVVAGSFVLKITYTLLTFIISIILARCLGPNAYGIYLLAITLVSVLSIIVQFGSPVLVMRVVAQAHIRQEWNIMKGIIYFSHTIVGVFTLIVILIGEIFIYFFSEKIGTEKATIFAWSFLLIPMISVGAIRDAVLRGLKKIILGNITEQLIRPLFFLILIVAIVNRSISINETIIMQLVSTFAAFFFSIILYKKKYPKELTKKKAIYEKKIWISSLISLGITGMLQLVNSHVDIFMIGAFKNDIDIAIYKVAAQLSSLIEFGLMAINTVVAPKFAELYAKKEMQRLQAVVTNSSIAILFVTILPFLVIIIFGQSIIGFLFGENYALSYMPLVIISIGQLLNAVTGSVGILLLMTGHEKEVSFGLGVAAIIHILLGIFLIPIFGVNGAAIATTISLALWNIILLNFVIKKLQIQTIPFNLSRRKT